MSPSNKMIALRTTLNGKKLCLAGAEDLCVLNSIVNAVGKLGDLSDPKRNADEPPDLFLSVGGLTGRTDGDDEHLRWTEHQPLSVGDEISITVVEVDEVDPPESRIPARSTDQGHDKRRYENALKTLVELEEKYGSDYMKILEAEQDD